MKITKNLNPLKPHTESFLPEQEVKTEEPVDKKVKEVGQPTRKRSLFSTLASAFFLFYSISDIIHDISMDSFQPTPMSEIIQSMVDAGQAMYHAYLMFVEAWIGTFIDSLGKLF